MPKRPCIMAIVLVLAAVLAIPAQAARGTAVECRRGDALRRIEVFRNLAPERACEVRYDNTGPKGVSRVAWFSAEDRDFCHERADTLIATLARTGWVCNVIRKRDKVAGGDSPAGFVPEGQGGPRIIVPRPQ